jgi:glucose-1-phosphate thymidylyltransferase
LSRLILSKDYTLRKLDDFIHTVLTAVLAVWHSSHYIANREPVEDEDLLIVAGDDIMDMHLEGLVNRFQEEESTYIVTYDIEDKEEATSYGVVDVDENGYVLDFNEKPDNPSSSLVSTACYMIPNEDIRFDEYLQNENNPDEPRRYMEWLRNQSDMRTYSFKGEWYDIGTPKGYISSVDWWMNGDKFVESSRDTSGTEIGSSSLVFGDGSLKNSKIERSVILSGCDIEGSEIKSSVIDSGVSITNVFVEDGIIGNKDN